MQLHLHPTRREALTASQSALTRWSLATNPATILAQMSTAPASVFDFRYGPYGDLHTYGGITGSPDGLLFAQEELWEGLGKGSSPCEIEWRRWDDFSLARSRMFLGMHGSFNSLACSPDGRWLVLESAEQLFLLDWQTGEVISRHDIGAFLASSLIFDASSTFVAGVFCSYDGGDFLKLWRLDPAERFVPRLAVKNWPTDELFPQDEVGGNMALTLIYEDWDRLGIEWPNRHLADAPGRVAFSPNSSIVLFSLHSSVGGHALVAFEMPSARLLWSTQSEVNSSAQPLFSPDGSVLLVAVEGGDLLVYRVEDGTLVQRMPTGLSQPIEALAFDHDGRTLWLATQEVLVQYQPQG